MSNGIFGDIFHADLQPNHGQPASAGQEEQAEARGDPWCGQLMIELARYRRENGLSLSPITGEDIPLLFRIGRDKAALRRPLTRSSVHTIVKKVFEDTAGRLRSKGEDYEGKAQTVERASAHWLRHTSGSRMMDSGVDIRQLRDNLGHESIATTNIYAHDEDDERHKQIEEKHRLGW